jgi:hypothetical protein
MKSLTTFSALILSLLLSLPSHANYLKGGLGVSLGDETEFDASGVTSTQKLKSSIMFPLLFAYGYELNKFLTFEGEFAVRHNDYDKINRSAQAITAGGNVIGTLPVDSYTFFGGVGANYGVFKLIGAKKDWGFAAQAFAGGDYRLASGTRLGIEYRYFMTLQDIDADAGVTGKYKNSAILLTAKYDF